MASTKINLQEVRTETWKLLQENRRLQVMDDDDDEQKNYY